MAWETILHLSGSPSYWYNRKNYFTYDPKYNYRINVASLGVTHAGAYASFRIHASDDIYAENAVFVGRRFTPSTLGVETIPKSTLDNAYNSKGAQMYLYIWEAAGLNDDQYWDVYLQRELINTAPTTPGAFTSPASGTVLNGGQTVTVTHGPSTDADGDALTYIVNAEYWNGTSWVGNTVLRNGTASLTGSHTLSTNKSYSKVRFGAIARDNNGATSSITRYSSEFTLSHNAAPTITATAPSGTYETKPSFNYNVSDPDGNPMTITEAIDGIIFNTRTGVASGTQLTFTPTDLAWLRTRIKQTVNITITIDDGNGGVTTVNYPITRTTPAIDLQLKTPFETDVAAKRLLLKLEGSIPVDAVVNVQACNNAFDASPTWENATNLVLSGFPHPFNNTVKTAVKWGISFKVRIERGSSTQSIYLDGVGGAFD